MRTGAWTLFTRAAAVIHRERVIPRRVIVRRDPDQLIAASDPRRAIGKRASGGRAGDGDRGIELSDDH